MADRQVARQLLECGLVECFGHLPHRARRTNPGTVGRDDPSALLAAMLESVEAEVREVGRLGMPEDPEDAALVLELVEHGCADPSPGSANLFYAARPPSCRAKCVPIEVDQADSASLD